MLEQIIFWFFAIVLVAAGVAVITVRNPVQAALFLVLAFFTSSRLWLLLEAEFLAIVLVLVYVGAVMVLFLFVVMMLDINLTRLREGFIRNLPVGLAVAFLMMAAMAAVVGRGNFGWDSFPPPERHAAGYSNTAEIGQVLYTQYVYQFEIAAVILLVAIIAAIALTLRSSRQQKRQSAKEQVSVRREDRIRIVKMDAERDQP